MYSSIIEYVRLGEPHDAIVFDGLGNNQTVWWCLMTKNYGKLADHLVRYPGDTRTREELIEMLKSRTQRTVGRKKGVFEIEGDAPIIQEPMAAHWAKRRFPAVGS